MSYKLPNFNAAMARNSVRAAYEAQRRQAEKIKAVWERTGLLEGLNEEEKYTMAQVLDNQAKQIINEVSRTGGPAAEEWSGVALPLVRRIFGSISAKDFVSVQPMSIPSGLVFYLDFKYGTKQPNFNVLSGQYNQENSVYGVTSAPGEPTGGLYGAGRFGYSKNDYTFSTAIVAVNDVTWEDVDFNPALEADAQPGTDLRKVTIDMTGTMHDWQGVRGFVIDDNGVKIATFYPAYTKPMDENGAFSKVKVTFIVRQVNGQILQVGDNVTIHYFKQTADYARGDFEASKDPAWGDGEFGPDKYNPTNVGANAIDIPEINIEMMSIPIVATTRKLKATWTPEFAQDLQAYHSIDAEAQLTAILSEYIASEIDLELLEMLMVAAPTKDVWDAKIGSIWTGGSTFDTQDGQQGRALKYNQIDWFQTFGVKLRKMSNIINQKTMRGGANFIVVSPVVATVIESLNGFVADADPNSNTYALGVQKVGTLQNQFTVYKNPYMPTQEVLVGFKGQSFLETGAVYAPYIPLITTPDIYDPVNLTPRKGVMTRYAKVVTRPEFYGRITVANPQLI